MNVLALLNRAGEPEPEPLEKKQEPELEPLEKKSGAGATKKFVGYPALIESYRII